MDWRWWGWEGSGLNPIHSWTWKGTVCTRAQLVVRTKDVWGCSAAPEDFSPTAFTCASVPIFAVRPTHRLDVRACVCVFCAGEGERVLEHGSEQVFLARQGQEGRQDCLSGGAATELAFFSITKRNAFGSLGFRARVSGCSAAPEEPSCLFCSLSCFDYCARACLCCRCALDLTSRSVCVFVCLLVEPLLAPFGVRNDLWPFGGRCFPC